MLIKDSNNKWYGGVAASRIFKKSKDIVKRRILKPGGDTLKNDWYMIGLVGIMLIFGLAFLSSSLSGREVGFYQKEFMEQFFFGIWVGVGTAFFLSRIDYHHLFRLTKPIMIISSGMLVFLFLFVGYSWITGTNLQSLITQLDTIGWLPIKPHMANGSLRWIEVSFLQNFQPSELAKFALLLYLAATLQKYQGEELSFARLKNFLWYFMVTMFLIVVQPDLGSVIIIALIILGAMWIANVPARILTSIAIVGAIGSTLLIGAYSYRMQRVNTFLDFYNDSSSACADNIASGSNFQVCQVRSAITGGGLLGKGYGNSNAKIRNSIPEINTDGILAVIGEEVGFVGTSLFLLLYILLFLRSLDIAMRAPDAGGKALASGIAFWILLQAFFNVAGITGLLPLKGVPLPFVSKGGTALVINLAIMGIILNISSQKLPKENTKQARVFSLKPKTTIF